jgi:CheY-like chemotaxis protein
MPRKKHPETPPDPKDPILPGVNPVVMLAHELRNPLAAVRNATELLARASEPAIIAQAREIIERQTGNMVRMIDDLLDVSAHHAAQDPASRGGLDVAELLRRCGNPPHHRVAGGGPLAHAHAARRAGVGARGSARLEQVVANLLNNAASSRARAALSGWLAQTAGQRPWAVIRVRDNGVGIEPGELLPRIFDVFVRAEMPAGRRSPGRPRAHARQAPGGAARWHDRGVQRRRGDGRIRRASAFARGGREARAAGPAPTARRKSVPPRRILIVDDNVDSAESMRVMFRVAGHDVRVLGEGASAADVALQFRPDAVLLDICLPDMVGHAVARAMRKFPELDRTLVVAVTGYGREEDMRKSRDAGIDEHMTKPIDADRLFDLIATGRGAARDRAD